MKLLTATFLLLSSSVLSAAAGSGIRGADVKEREESNAQTTQSTRDLQLFRSYSTSTSTSTLIKQPQVSTSTSLVKEPLKIETITTESSIKEPVLQTELIDPRLELPDDDDKPLDNPTEVEGKETGEAPPAEKVDPLEDIRITAASMGLTVCEAQVLLQQQEEFSSIVDKLQDDINFNQAEMPSEPDGEFRIFYKEGDVPDKSAEMIEDFMAKYEKSTVKIVSTVFSLKDAQERGDEFARILEDKQYLEVSFSLDGDKIELMAKNPSNEDCGPSIPKSRAAEILGLEEDSPYMVGVSLILMRDEEGVDTVKPLHTYGGRKISGGGYQCTTAFSVITGSGTTGVATAAHCTGMNKYDAVLPETDYDTYFQGQHRGTYGDVEWHTTPHWELAEYYARPNERRPVTSVANSISKNQWVCGYSRMQGTRKCDKVYKTSVSVKYSGLPRMYNLVAMDNMMMIGGDSGGPWSHGNKAYGIVSGGKVICDFLFFGCEWRDIWSRASYLSPALGVMVRTQ